MQEKENMIKILRESVAAVKDEDIVRMRDLSDRTVHTASIYQDPDNIAVAVIVYSLSKVLERKKYTQYREWPTFYNEYVKNMKRALLNLERDDIDGARINIKNIEKAINNLSGHFKIYVKEVFRKAQISKASRIYEHGISMEQTAKLLGITIWELAEYTGETGIGDVDLSITMPIRERIKQAQRIFEE